MAAALPDNGDGGDATTTTTEGGAPPAPAAALDTRAQEHGWVPRQAYDYEAYTQSRKDLAEAQAAFTGDEPELAVGGLAGRKWHSDVRTTSLILPSLNTSKSHY